MHTMELLEATWQARPPADPAGARVALLVLRRGGGEHTVVPRAEFSVERGMDGDRWSAAKDPEREQQVTVMSLAVARALAASDTPEDELHRPGDNVLVERDLDEADLPVGTQLRVGEVVLEITATPHLGCSKFSARFGGDALRWVNAQATRPRRMRGVNCRIVVGGAVQLGDRLTVVSRP